MEGRHLPLHPPLLLPVPALGAPRGLGIWQPMLAGQWGLPVRTPWTHSQVRDTLVCRHKESPLATCLQHFLKHLTLSSLPQPTLI